MSDDELELDTLGDRKPAIVKPDVPFDLYELKATDLQPDN